MEMYLYDTKEFLSCKPFLRWAGGKTWLLKDLSYFLPKSGFNRYFEPFLGGGAVYFHLQPKDAFLSDANAELIETYQCLQKNVYKVINELQLMDNNKEEYYSIREQKYRSKYKRAARFIYLNQTSFNGIYRVNQKGEYNVPYGYRTIDHRKEDNLKIVNRVIQNTHFSSGDFAEIEYKVKKKDLVFLDPPYTVSHNNNGFIKYNKKLFSLDDQYRLLSLIQKIKEKDAYYILTNAAHTKIFEIFGKEDNAYELSRANRVGGENALRNTISEYLFSNIEI
ncbi:MAG: Dam family site-specific DNA-(adenine-N6)-methyltransferase [Bacteroidota bacterium]